MLGFCCGMGGYTRPDNFPIRQVKIFATFEHVDQSFCKRDSNYLDSAFLSSCYQDEAHIMQIPW